MKSFLKYLITMGVGALAVILIVSSMNIYSVTAPDRIFHILCDAFFVVGVVMTGLGLLIFTCNEGVFDGLVYGVSTFIGMFRRNLDRKYKTFFDYKNSRADRKLSFGFIVLCGLIFLFVSIVMYLIYRSFI